MLPCRTGRSPRGSQPDRYAVPAASMAWRNFDRNRAASLPRRRDSRRRGRRRRHPVPGACGRGPEAPAGQHRLRAGAAPALVPRRPPAAHIAVHEVAAGPGPGRCVGVLPGDERRQSRPGARRDPVRDGEDLRLGHRHPYADPRRALRADRHPPASESRREPRACRGDGARIRERLDRAPTPASTSPTASSASTRRAPGCPRSRSRPERAAGSKKRSSTMAPSTSATP